MSHDVLLVVDPQEGFISDKSVIENIIDVWDHFDTVVVSKFVSGNPLYEQAVGWDGLGDEGEQLHDDVVERIWSVSVFEKDAYSALANEDLRRIISMSGIDRIYVAGFETDSCVLSTAFSLFDAGVRPVVLIDCCGSSNEEVSKGAEMIIERNFGQSSLIQSEAVVE